MINEYSLYNSSIDKDQDSLTHYGRLGMKWYQHIFGEYQGAAKYAEKGEAKLSNLKAKNAKLTNSIDSKVAKYEMEQGKHALKSAKYRAAKKNEKAMSEDVLAAKYGAKSASLKNAKQKALNKETKLSDKVDRVKNTVKELEKKNAEEAKRANDADQVKTTEEEKPTGDLKTRIDRDYYSPDTDAWSDPPREEIDRAADLGLKALVERGEAEASDVGDPGKREWFLYEDQTIGMPTVAHLIDKGHPAKDVKEFIRKVNDKYDNSDDDDEADSIYDKYFDLLWGDDLEGFADDCEKVKRRDSAKHHGFMDDYIAHGDALLDDMLYSEDELYHWKLGFSMPNHKWIERLGTPGHYIYKYADDLHEALTGDRARARYAELAGIHGQAAERAKTAAENTAAASIVAKAMGKNDYAERWHRESQEKKAEYEQEEKYAQAYSNVVKEIANLPINRFRKNVSDFIGETADHLSDWVNKGTSFLQGLFGKKAKPREVPSRPDRPHQRKARKEVGTAHVKKNDKVNWWEGWGKKSTGQQLYNIAAKKREEERKKQRERAQKEAAKWLNKKKK